MLQLIFMSRRTAGYSRSSRSNKVLLGRKAYQGQSGYPGLVGEIGSLKTTGPTSSSATVPDLILASFNSTSELFIDGNQLLLYLSVTDPTSNITDSDLNPVQISAGYYKFSNSICNLQ